MKYGAPTSLAAIELDKFHVDKYGNTRPTFKVLFRIEIPQNEFTYTNAINKIIELNDIYDFDHIAVDRGAGEVQIEILHKYGMDNPETGLHEKVKGYHFGSSLDVRDPHTGKVDSKPMKPFMVNNSVVVFERERIIFHPDDDKLLEQFIGYRVESISSNGIPTYSSENEHFVDAINLALLIFEQNYGDLMKRIISTKVVVLNDGAFKGMEEKEVKSRKIESKKDKVEEKIVGTIGRTGKIVNVVGLGRKKRTPQFTRKRYR